MQIFGISPLNASWVVSQDIRRISPLRRFHPMVSFSSQRTFQWTLHGAILLRRTCGTFPPDVNCGAWIVPAELSQLLPSFLQTAIGSAPPATMGVLPYGIS